MTSSSSPFTGSMTSGTDQMICDKWHSPHPDNKNYYLCSAPTDYHKGFVSVLKSTDNPVSYFEFVQDCNSMGHEYIRCFYRLQQDQERKKEEAKGRTIIYQIVPFEVPYLRYKKEDKLLPVTKRSEDSIWECITEKYDLYSKPYVLTFTLKEKTKPAVGTRVPATNLGPGEILENFKKRCTTGSINRPPTPHPGEALFESGSRLSKIEQLAATASEGDQEHYKLLADVEKERMERIARLLHPLLTPPPKIDPMD